MLNEKLKILDNKFKSINNIPENYRSLKNVKVDLDRINDIEVHLGYELSSELKMLYSFVDGDNHESTNADNEAPLFLGKHRFNPIDIAVEIALDLREFAATAPPSEHADTYQGNLYREYHFNHKLGAIKNQEYNNAWFPLGSIEGMSTYIMVDHDPEENGTFGQVIFIDLGRKALLLASSVEEYFNRLIDNYKYVSNQNDDYKAMLRLAKGGIFKRLSK